MSPTTNASSHGSAGPASSMGRSTPRRRSAHPPLLWRLVAENFWLKMVSLLVAIGFYASLHSTTSAQRTLQLPIVADMPGPDAKRVLVSELPQTISVSVEGPRQQLDDLAAHLDPVTLDLRKGEDGVVRFDARTITGLPRNTRVTRILPDSLAVRWENLVSRAVTVQVPLAGHLQNGLEMRGEPEVQPREVMAMGPETLVKGIQLVRTEPLEVSALLEGRSVLSLPLAHPPGKVQFDRPNVDVTVEVTRKRISREFLAKVEAIGPRGARARPSLVRLTIVGTPERLVGLRADGIIARADARAAGVDTSRPGSAMVPVTVDVSEASVTSEPAQVLVTW